MQGQTEARQEREYHSPDKHTPEGAPVKPAVKARQGLISGHVILVLTISLILVVVAFTATYIGAF